ncbi:OadG family protein [Pseudaeromonas paramecii]
MDISAMLLEAFKLLIIGMGFVYLLLGIMVGAVNLLARFAAEPTSAQSQPNAVGHVPHTADLDPQLVAAISTAVHQHRRQ